MPIDLTALRERCTGPGKFEGEGPVAVHFYDRIMDGDGTDVTDDMGDIAGTVFLPTDIDDEERAAFDIDDEECVVVVEDANGFVYCTFEEDAQARLAMPSNIVQCQCGDYLCDELCTFRGPIEETVVVEVMPEYLRASHQAAGGWGTYPLNGSRRLRVHRECAELLCEGDEYNHVV